MTRENMKHCCPKCKTAPCQCIEGTKEKKTKKCVKLNCPKKKHRCYFQPPVPQSYAPIRLYQRPQEIMQADTVYQLSFKTVDCDVRRKPIIKSGNLISNSNTAKMAGDTIYKLSYVPNEFMNKIITLKHCSNDLFGKGPMQDLTTSKHDYVPKTVKRRKALKPTVNTQLSTKPFEGKTTYDLSYQEPGSGNRAIPFTPIILYKPPTDKMESVTVQKLSYLPNKNMPKWIPPSSKKPEYIKPCVPFESDTVYKNSYPLPGWIGYGSECSCNSSDTGSTLDTENENQPCPCVESSEPVSSAEDEHRACNCC